MRSELEERPNIPPTSGISISSSLDQGERQQAPMIFSQRSSTEKYHYVVSLAAQRMDAKGIASAQAEVEQLFQRSQLQPLLGDDSE